MPPQVQRAVRYVGTSSSHCTPAIEPAQSAAQKRTPPNMSCARPPHARENAQMQHGVRYVEEGLLSLTQAGGGLGPLALGQGAQAPPVGARPEPSADGLSASQAGGHALPGRPHQDSGRGGQAGFGGPGQAGSVGHPGGAANVPPSELERELLEVRPAYLFSESTRERGNHTPPRTVACYPCLSVPHVHRAIRAHVSPPSELERELLEVRSN